MRNIHYYPNIIDDKYIPIYCAISRQLFKTRTSAADYFISLRSSQVSDEGYDGRIISPGENKEFGWLDDGYIYGMYSPIHTPVYGLRVGSRFPFPEQRTRSCVLHCVRNFLRTAAIWLACEREPKKAEAEGRVERWRYLSFVVLSFSLFVSLSLCIYYLSLSLWWKCVRYVVKKMNPMIYKPIFNIHFISIYVQYMKSSKCHFCVTIYNTSMYK